MSPWESTRVATDQQPPTIVGYDAFAPYTSWLPTIGIDNVRYYDVTAAVEDFEHADRGSFHAGASACRRVYEAME